MKKKTKGSTCSIIAALLFAAVLSGCSGGGSKSMYAETMAATMDSVSSNQTIEMEAPAMGALVEEGSIDTASSVDSGSQEAASGIASQNTETPQISGRKLIRNIDMNVETTSFDDLISSVQSKVTQLEGYVEQSDISGNSITNYGRPALKYAHLVLRIPAEQLNTFISQVETDSNVTYKSETVSDVTLQYSDVESRLKTLRMEQERLWELMASADSTEAILALEQRLTDVSIEIESSESRLRHFDNSILYSTVNLNISEVNLESPTQPETPWQQIQRGFSRNLISLGDFVTAFLIGFLSGIPTILFILLLIVLFFLAVKATRKRIWRFKHKTPGQKESSIPSTSSPETAPEESETKV
ncbi:MAG: DUF4349 domain-containing protein [Lachnospiraceae bacterium]|jgi:hypothetical protein|nr:DUF4349 domain-containing protein [Lachnospiraceae bacterium]